GYATKRRIFQLVAKFSFLFVEAVEIMSAGILNGRMERSECLPEDFAFDIATTGAARDLSEELEGSFTGAKIGLVQGQVGVNDSDQRDVRKMQSLGNHLSADEDVDFSRAKLAEH